MSKYSLILFDMDGTIANTDELLVRSMNYLYDKYRNGNRTPVEQVYYFSGPPIVGTLAKEFPNQDIDKIFKEFCDISYSLYDECTKEYPFCREALIALKNKGIKFATVTNKSHKPAIHALEIIRLDDLIDVIIGWDDVSKSKPNPEGCLKAMELSGISDKSKVLYVGDNKIDFDTATNAGIDCALVNWGPRKLPSDLNPKYKFNSYKEFLEIVLNA